MLEIRKEAWEAEGGIHNIKLSDFPAEVRGSLVSAKRLRAPGRVGAFAEREMKMNGALTQLKSLARPSPPRPPAPPSLRAGRL